MPPPEVRFEPVEEADFEPLLALRIEVMREHLERVGRFHPERARRIFRGHFDEPGLRRLTIGGQRVGCVGFRVGAAEVKIDSFYLDRRLHNSGLGTAILKGLLAEADALGLPVELDVLQGSPAGRFYERHGFVKQREDAIEANYRRPVPR
ncbi:MAG: GNAT family N-acetyltransferase [Proteobacteria bacterium]|nr:GNAT family N-acetyltransferase [Pseudomonadota bacterium]